MLGRYLMHGLAGVTDPAVAQRWLETAQAAGAEAEFEALHPDRELSLEPA